LDICHLIKYHNGVLKMNIRKLFIPVVAGLLSSPALMAADVATPSLSAYVSDEYLSTAPATLALGHFEVGFTIEAEYAVGDIINLTFTGSALDESTLPTTIVGTGPAGTATVTLGLLSADADAATYRVTEVDTGSGNSTVDVSFALCAPAGLECDFNANAVAANGGVVMSFSAQTGTGLNLDTSGGADRSEALFVTGSQFAASVPTPFNGIIDVEEARKEFTDGTADAATWIVNAGAVSCGGAMDPCEDILATASTVGQEQELSIAGDFSWVVDSIPGTPELDPAGPVFTWINCASPAYSAAAITADCGYGSSTLTIDVFANVPAAALPAGGFVSTHVLNFLGADAAGAPAAPSSITVTNVNLGEWTLNGFQAKVAYMPFGTGIGQVIYLANRGAQTGTITVEWIDQNGASGSFDIGAIAAGSTRAIGPAIQAGLPEAQQTAGRLALTISANVPACDAQLNAQYNAGGDRAFSVATNNCD
jgi:hypothetical protein